VQSCVRMNVQGPSQTTLWPPARPNPRRTGPASYREVDILLHARLDRPWLRAAKSYPDVAGSGDKQAKAELCCIEIDEVAVAFCPPT